MTSNLVIILQVVNIIMSALSPLIVSFSYLIKNISSSSCCGGEIRTKKSSSNDIKS